MTKILSICIASYNMEEYLPRCVESMLGAGVNDELEIIIVNDGSTDRTLEIANGYKAKYPDTVVVIDKENGHYGSCINASLKVAKGKYFRTVDADDWVDSDGLRRFVEVLRNNDADCFQTKFSTHDLKSDGELIRGVKNDNLYRVINVDDLDLNWSYIMMHCITWRLSLLHDINYQQTSGIYYTDNEYVFLPWMSARTVFLTDIMLYHYIIGRQGQSVSVEEIIRFNNHYFLIYNRIKEYRPPHANSQAEKIRDLGCRSMLTLLFANHIVYNYKNKKEDAKFKKIIAELIASGKTYEDIFMSDSLNTKLIRMWNEPSFIGNLILYLRRSQVRNNGLYLFLKSIHEKIR